MFTKIFDTYSQNPAVITDYGQVITYAELGRMVNDKAACLTPHVLQFCLCENNIESVVMYLACLLAKAPAVMLNAHMDETLLNTLRAIYHPGDTLCHPNLALCLTTSGSTGSPKLVRLTMENIISNAESIASYLQIDEQERAITMLPMYYSYGLSIVNSHLLKGATLLLTDKTYAQREFWNFLREHKATSMAGVPYTWEMLKRLRFFRMDLPSVKTMTQAGGKLNADLAKEYIQNAREQGKRFIVMYGQTEATARMSYLPWERAEEKYASIGIAIPGGRFELADDGELVYYGDNVSMGYADCAKDLQKGDENHGVLHTGDIARVDEDGFYYIVGRKKRFVKIWGNRCNLDAIEQLVKSLGIADCAIVGVDDMISIFITDSEKEGDIVRMLSEKTGLNTRAFRVQQIDKIPTKESGKIDYPTLQAML